MALAHVHMRGDPFTHCVAVIFLVVYTDLYGAIIDDLKLLCLKARRLRAMGHGHTHPFSRHPIKPTYPHKLNHSQVMGQMNEQMDAKDTAKVMAEFTKQNEYMNVKEDMLDDALMDAVGREGGQEGRRVEGKEGRDGK